MIHKPSQNLLYASNQGADLKIIPIEQDDVLTNWIEENAGGGYFYLVHEASGRKLHSNGDFTTVNTAEPIYTGNNVQWRWVCIGDDSYARLEHKASGNGFT